jgi:hypothetical protein
VSSDSCAHGGVLLTLSLTLYRVSVHPTPAMILMMAFYNNHMNFYPNYACMLGRWVQVILRRFVFKWPPRPSVILFVPAGLWTAKLGYHAFFPAPSQSEGDTGDKEDDKASSN